jgi:gliding motility-associated-like protein
LAIDSADCNGDPTGIINFAGNGGSAPYSYSINAGPLQSNGTFDSLIAGAYQVRMVDTDGCDTTYTIRVLEPQIVDLVVTNIDSTNCPFGSDGAVSLNATGGTTPYLYALVGNAWTSATNFPNMSAGSYHFVVEDKYGCSDSIWADVDQPAPIELASTVVDSVVCHGDPTGAITLTSQGGHSPYSYAMGNSPFQGNNSFTGLTTGNYTIRIRDNRGCDTAYSFFVPEPNPLDASMAQMDSVDCFGNSTGALLAGAIGGTPSYQYKLDNGSWGGSPQFNNLPQGWYVLHVQDANGCEDTAWAEVLEPLPLNGVLTNVDSVICHGDATGAFTIHPTGGTAPHMFSIDGVNFQSSPTFDSLQAQIYTVTIEDQNGCRKIISFPVPQNPPFNFTVNVDDVLCHGDLTGWINVTASGNTPPYQYSLNGMPYQSSGNFPNLPAGNYSVGVMDANNCAAILAQSIQQPPRIGVSLAMLDSVYFLYGNDGSFELNTWGGVAPLQYSLDGGLTFQNSTLFDSLEAGTYEVLIQDKNGCDTLIQVIVPNHIPSPDFGIVNAFTPNGDGQNDFFEIVDKRNEYEIMTFQVFNRWGQVIFDGPALGLDKWDGTYKGELQPMGNYAFLIQMRRIDGIEFDPIPGNVLLIW